MRLVVAELDVVSESERDDYLRVFSHHPIQTEEEVDWARERTDIPEDAALSPKEVAKTEHTVLALPDSMLARLPESFLATLPADVQDAVRARLAR